MHPERTTVRFGFRTGGFFFFENAETCAITVNGIRYYSTASDFLLLYLDGVKTENSCSLQNGTARRTSRAIIDFLHGKFPECVVSIRDDRPWSPSNIGRPHTVRLFPECKTFYLR